jgi:cysteinyl-tRNA synthetase
VCGPTVYNFIHIGNARPSVVFDTLRRYLEYKGLKVTFVTNFTDVDDKIIKTAMADGVSAAEISERFIEEYLVDMRALNIPRGVIPGQEKEQGAWTRNQATDSSEFLRPKATCEIPDMVEMIGELIAAGHAYEKNGNVYFRARSFSGYGKLSGKNIDDLNMGSRIAVSDEKEDEADFVLWKPKKPGEPAWESPWGEGRPGWHIECSVMSRKYLGEQIDIHAGGEDLIFPHHENEIAQTESLTGKPFAKYWMHNGFINIDSKKMSKSEGNFITVREIAKVIPLNALRFFLLGFQYRSPINYSRESVLATKSGLDRIFSCIQALEAELVGHGAEPTPDAEADAIFGRFLEAMDDDLNTADAIAALFELVKHANKLIPQHNADILHYVYQKISDMCGILGIEMAQEQVDDTSDAAQDEGIHALIEKRQAARAAKDFAAADAIRNELSAKGIVLEDTKDGVKWKRA